MIELPFTSVSETIVTRAVIGLLTLLTAATSGVAGYKIIKATGANTPPTVQAVEVPKDQSSQNGTTNDEETDVSPMPEEDSSTDISLIDTSIGQDAVSPTQDPFPVDTTQSVPEGGVRGDDDDDDKREYEEENGQQDIDDDEDVETHES